MITCWVSGPGVPAFSLSLPALPRAGEMLFVEGTDWAVRVRDVQWQLRREEGRPELILVNVLVARADERSGT